MSILENSSNKSDSWDRFCQSLWYSESLGFWLDISRMNLNAKSIEDLNTPIQKAITAMSLIESGAKANIDEGRQVGHYWLRTPNLAPAPEISQSIQTEIEEVIAFSNNINNGKIKTSDGRLFTDIFWIGIGGSGLGPLLIKEVLKSSSTKLSIHFLDNIDPDGIKDKIINLEQKILSTLFVVVSKSGGTPEPRICMDQLRSHLEENGGIWAQQSVAITMKGSKLDLKAKNENWLKTFDLPEWVGGRTSITSPVGLLPAALLGANAKELLQGASQMDKYTSNKSFNSNPAALLAASWYIAGEGKGKRDMVVLPYKDKLELFSRYLQQLVMESLGKKLSRDGITVHQGISVFGNKGSTDQHAYVQQLRDGIDNFFVTFIEVLKDKSDLPIINNERPSDFLSGFLQGTRSALSEAGKQSITITIKEINERTLGALIALFERAVGIYAELININAYDQPGVEAGKIAASDILKLQELVINSLADKKPKSLIELANELKLDSPEPIYWILRYLSTNDSKYLINGNWIDPSTITVRIA